MLSEGLSEITAGTKTSFHGDFHDTVFRKTQQPACHLHPVGLQISERGDAQHFLKTAEAFPLTDMSGTGNIRQRDIIHVMLLNVDQHCF